MLKPRIDNVFNKKFGRWASGTFLLFMALWFKKATTGPYKNATVAEKSINVLNEAFHNSINI